MKVNASFVNIANIIQNINKNVHEYQIAISMAPLESVLRYKFVSHAQPGEVIIVHWTVHINTFKNNSL